LGTCNHIPNLLSNNVHLHPTEAAILFYVWVNLLAASNELILTKLSRGALVVGIEYMENCI